MTKHIIVRFLLALAAALLPSACSCSAPGFAKKSAGHGEVTMEYAVTR